jgi:beta-glucanase (GH16 family)
MVLFVANLSSTPQKAHAASWTEVWNDEFSGAANTKVDSLWQYDTGTSYPGGAANWGTGEVETMTNSTTNVYQDGSGHLVIKPVKSNNAWTSGRIETVNTGFAAPAGGELEVTASLQMPNVTGAAAQGYWPAFWMLGAAFRGNYTNWPSVGEIDAMENVNGTNVEYGTLHCGVDPGGPCTETSGLGGNTPCTGTTCQAGYHTYTVIVDRSTSPEEIRWYLDGVEFWHVDSNRAGMDATTWANAVDHGFFIILNVAMGGSWPGNPTSSTQSGVGMNVDYVRVYTASGSTSSPTATPTATPTSTGSCTGTYTSGVVSSSSSTALPWFKPCGWTAGYVILHYVANGGTQQNVYMTYNSSTARWEYTVPGISAGQVLTYSFTYQQNGLQYDTGTSTWTHP